MRIAPISNRFRESTVSMRMLGGGAEEVNGTPGSRRLSRSSGLNTRFTVTAGEQSLTFALLLS